MQCWPPKQQRFPLLLNIRLPVQFNRNAQCSWKSFRFESYFCTSCEQLIEMFHLWQLFPASRKTISFIYRCVYLAYNCFLWFKWQKTRIIHLTAVRSFDRNIRLCTLFNILELFFFLIIPYAFSLSFKNKYVDHRKRNTIFNYSSMEVDVSKHTFC